VAGDSTPHAGDLEAMVPQRFRGNLRVSEKRMLRAAPKGEDAVCGPNFDDKDAANDPTKADHWSSDREIRAELIRWLCTTTDASRMVDPRGVRVYAANVTGKLDLSYASVPFPLHLVRCRLTDDADLTNVTMAALYLHGTSARSLIAEGADVKGSVFLADRFSCDGEVRLSGARILGQLNCAGASFRFRDGWALSADHGEIKGSVLLNESLVEGGVRLSGSRVGGNLECDAGAFTPNRSGIALLLEHATIEGSVFLRNNFSAQGEVRLLGTQIGSSLECGHGKFGLLRLDTATVRGTFFWDQDAHSEQLDLINASVGAISDDRASWPDRGDLVLDGFVYERISGGPMGAEDRLDWLSRQREFKRQPYRQLAKVLREMGTTTARSRFSLSWQDGRGEKTGDSSSTRRFAGSFIQPRMSSRGSLLATASIPGGP
jgi:hypothetical protein